MPLHPAALLRCGPEAGAPLHTTDSPAFQPQPRGGRAPGEGAIDQIFKAEPPISLFPHLSLGLEHRELRYGQRKLSHLLYHLSHTGSQLGCKTLLLCLWYVIAPCWVGRWTDNL